MKKLLLLCIILLAGGSMLQVSAQSKRLGLKAGINYSGVASPTEGPQRRLAPVAGVFAQVPLFSNGFLLLQPELLYSVKGSKSTYATGTYVTRLYYLDLPIVAKLTLGNLFFELGPQASFLVAARYQTPTGTSSDLRGANRIVAGAAAGAGYQLPMGMGVTLRYTHDLNRLGRGPRNTVFQLQASYLLGNN